MWFLIYDGVIHRIYDGVCVLEMAYRIRYVIQSMFNYLTSALVTQIRTYGNVLRTTPGSNSGRLVKSSGRLGQNRLYNVLFSSLLRVSGNFLRVSLN